MQHNLTSNIVKLLMIKQSMIQDKIDMKVEYIDHICINDIEKWFLGFLFILSHGPFKCSLTY
jgi:hypothetical protein